MKTLLTLSCASIMLALSFGVSYAHSGGGSGSGNGGKQSDTSSGNQGHGSGQDDPQSNGEPDKDSGHQKPAPTDNPGTGKKKPVVTGDKPVNVTDKSNPQKVKDTPGGAGRHSGPSQGGGTGRHTGPSQGGGSARPPGGNPPKPPADPNKPGEADHDANGNTLSKSRPSGDSSK